MVLTLLILSCPQVYWSKDALKNPMPWSSQPCPVITVLMTVISNFIVFLTECFEDRDIPCLSPYCQCLHTPDTWQALSYTHMHAQLCPALCDPINCSPPGSSVHGIAQPGIPEWAAISFSRESSWPRDWTHISCTGRRILTSEPPGKILPPATLY